MLLFENSSHLTLSGSLLPTSGLGFVIITVIKLRRFLAAKDEFLLITSAEILERSESGNWHHTSVCI